MTLTALARRIHVGRRGQPLPQDVVDEVLRQQWRLLADVPETEAVAFCRHQWRLTRRVPLRLPRGAA